MRNDALDLTGKANTDRMPLTQAERLELAEERKKEAALKWVNYDCKIHGQYTFREDREPRCRKCVEVSRSVRTPYSRPTEKTEPLVIKELPYHEVELTVVEIGKRKIKDVIRVDKLLTKGDVNKALAYGKEFFIKQYGRPTVNNFVDLSVKALCLNCRTNKSMENK